MEQDRVVAADYLVVALAKEARKVVIRRCVLAARKIDKERPFEAVAFTGTSGLLVGPELASRLGKSLILVNKESTNRHCNLLLEGLVSRPVNYLFVDDLVASGATQRRVVRVIRAAQPGSQRVATLLWASSTGRPGWDPVIPDRWHLWGEANRFETEYQQLRNAHWDSSGRQIREESDLERLENGLTPAVV